MLRWRLVLGTLIVAILVGMAWLDHVAEGPDAALPKGIWLLPVAIFFAVTATREALQLAAAGGMRPAPWAVYCGNLLLILSGWLPAVGRGGAETAPLVERTAWPVLALVVGVMLVLVGEMRRYEKPGGVTANVAAAAFTLVYVGLMLSFAVQLRMAYGVAALASLVIVVKMADTGAYTVGRLIGRHRLSPVLSPGKTIEGAIGGVVFACLASWITFTWLVPAMARGETEAGLRWGWVLFALLASTAGMLGDLAESLLKRDVGRKDSSRWLPGLGGVLDLLDSLLLAAPVAWFCWAVGLVGG
ncbi:MAG: phosphatidate cytidylyltransferase [Planctomycetota bacterium]|jgi:phosphatidate cytidylyltransferase